MHSLSYEWRHGSQSALSLMVSRQMLHWFTLGSSDSEVDLWALVLPYSFLSSPVDLRFLPWFCFPVPIVSNDDCPLVPVSGEKMTRLLLSLLKLYGILLWVNPFNPNFDWMLPNDQRYIGVEKRGQQIRTLPIRKLCTRLSSFCYILWSFVLII